MTTTLRSPAELAGAGLVAPRAVAALDRVAERYAVAVTPEMARLIDVANPADPIARQFIPSEAERRVTPEERADPIGDAVFSPLPGLVHRYPDRVLLKPLHVCPVYCRFCFRREVVGPKGAGTLTDAELTAALDYVAGHPAIWEVIVTGGDPFLLSARRIARLTAAIAAIPHVKVLRWHTRVPVVAPKLVGASLVAALKRKGVTTYVAIHANHPRELTPAARRAIARLADAGLPLLSQTVLLRGVNDDADTLAALMRSFVENRIKPYYLHQADLAPGTSHFRTSIAEGQALMRALRGRLSGIAQPTYVLDVPDGAGKVPVGPSYIEDGRILTVDGESVAYPLDK